MNYAEYLRRRLASPSNGVITDENLFKSTKNGGTFEVIYRVYDPLGVLKVGFGYDSLLAHSGVSYAQGIASIVGAGWELLDRGADLVVVTINGINWTCSREMMLSDDYVSFALNHLTDQVNLYPNGGIALWLHVGNQPIRRAWYNATGAAAHRNAYLASLNRYLTSVLGVIVQIGGRKDPAKPCSIFRDAPVVSSVGSFSRWGCHTEPIEALRTTIASLQLETLLDKQAATRDSLPDPIITVKITMGDIVWRFPLYGLTPPDEAGISLLEAGLEAVLSTVRKKVAIAIEDVSTEVVRLDIY